MGEVEKLPVLNNQMENLIKICECGCKQQIKVKNYHKWKGIPRFIKGHNFKGENHFFFGKKRPNFSGKNHPKYWLGKKRPNISERLKGIKRPYLSERYKGENNPMKKPELRKEKSIRMKEKYKMGELPLSGCAKLSKEGFLSGKNHPMYGKKQKMESIKKFKKWRKTFILPKKDTMIEVKIQNFLKELNIEFFTHQYMKIEHGYQCDIFIPSKNLVIECDGDFIHCNPLKYSSDFVRFPNSKKIITAQEIWDKDEIRTSELIKKGFKVLRLWEHEIKVMKIEDLEKNLENTRW